MYLPYGPDGLLYMEYDRKNKTVKKIKNKNKYLTIRDLNDSSVLFYALKDCIITDKFEVTSFKFPRELTLIKISPEINKLKGLINLELRNYEEDVNVLNLASLKHLKSLKLVDYKFYDPDKVRIDRLKKLKNFSLINVNVSEKFVDNIWQLKNLEKLEGYNIKFTFSSGIGNLKNLQELNIYKCETNYLPEEISKCTSLAIIIIADSFLRGTLPKNIGEMENLKYLRLSDNSLKGGIPSSIGKLKKLNNLDLKNNKLSGNIPDEIVKLERLMNLDIENNNLSRELPQDIGNLKKLVRLNLSKNNFSGSIPESICQTNLCYLLLSDNNLSGRIPTEIGNFNWLQHLDISNNYLSGAIPETFRYLYSLKKLNLSNNNFTGTIFDKMPDRGLYVKEDGYEYKFETEYDLSRKKETRNVITEIDISNNNFSGEILGFLYFSESLRKLNLSGNHFSGAVPGYLDSLKFLDIYGNNFVESYPEELDSIENFIK